jgi:hypothetical protein
MMKGGNAMNCKDYDALLGSYLEETLDEAQRAAMEEHLSTCPVCRFKLKVLEDCRTLDEQDEVPVTFSSAWRQRIKKEEAAPVKQFPRLTRWLAVAAALIVLVGGTYLAGQDRRNAGLEDAAAIGLGYDASEGYSGAPSPASAPDMAFSAERSANKEQSQQEKIIRTVRMEMSTREFENDYAAILQALSQAGGRVQDTGLYNNYGKLRTLYMTLRVPSEKLDSAIAALKGVGRLVSFTESSEDISEQYADLESRLKTQQTKMERLQVLLARAETVEDLITVETSISDTQYEIDRLTGQLRGMDSKVDYSTLNVTLNELSPAETSQDKDESLWERIKNGAAAAWDKFVYLLADFVVFLSIALPYLIILGIMILIIRIIIKRRKNK